MRTLTDVFFGGQSPIEQLETILPKITYEPVNDNKQYSDCCGKEVDQDLKVCPGCKENV